MSRGEKIKQSKAARKARLKSQTVVIDDNWKIIRSDPLNWEIRYKDEPMGYFPTICGAVKALPAKMLNEEAKGDLGEVLRSSEGIRAMIDKAIP